jgi:predicted NAD-dependent protein-ADP-ribosyltransferase YbiA (DUF1768 family)
MPRSQDVSGKKAIVTHRSSGRLRYSVVGYGLWQALVDYADAVLIEASEDAFWGIRKKGNGQNMLGTLLMELTAELKAEIDHNCVESTET